MWTTFDYQNARKLAIAWLELRNSEIELELIDGATITKPYWLGIFLSKSDFFRNGELR